MTQTEKDNSNKQMISKAVLDSMTFRYIGNHLTPNSAKFLSIRFNYSYYTK